MTTKQRIACLAPILAHYSGLGCRNARDLERWLVLELGAVDALEAWRKHGSHRTRAIAPATIYHILAGNLFVSGLQSLLCGLILGANNVIKVPTGALSQISAHDGGPFFRPVSEVEIQLRKFVAALPQSLQKLVAISPEFDAAALAHADAVIAYGTDETITKIRVQTRADQIFLGYGLQVSVMWLGKLKRWNTLQLAAIAHDICIYDQMGCLSPQAIYLERGSSTKRFCTALARAMKAEMARLPEPSVLTPGERGKMAEAIDLAQALGHEVWPAGQVTGAIILDPRVEFQFSCLHRTIVVHEVKPEQLPRALGGVRGKISTVGVVEKLSPALQELFIDLGVKRFCSVGRMQHPPLSWHHDGRPAISDLVRWVDDEIA